MALADRIAISPSPPICSEMSSSCFWAIPSDVAWLTNRSRHSGLVSASKVTTLVPADWASPIASQIASGSLADTMSALAPCWATVLMYDTWASGLAVSGPTSSRLASSSPAASSAPAVLVSK